VHPKPNVSVPANVTNQLRTGSQAVRAEKQSLSALHKCSIVPKNSITGFVLETTFSGVRFHLPTNKLNLAHT